MALDEQSEDEHIFYTECKYECMQKKFITIHQIVMKICNVKPYLTDNCLKGREVDIITPSLLLSVFTYTEFEHTSLLNRVVLNNMFFLIFV